jgi:hypothetical protein
VLDLAGNPFLGDCVPAAASDAIIRDKLVGLTSLDLTDCGLDQWEDVIGILSQTPEYVRAMHRRITTDPSPISLRALNISSNPLASINLPSSPPTDLPALDTLIMNDTRVQDWQSVDNLQILFGSSLRTFKFSLAEDVVIPNTTNDAHTPDIRRFKGKLEDRIYLIPKLPGLETLNGTTVSTLDIHFRPANSDGITLDRLRNMRGQTQSASILRRLPKWA